MSCNVRLTIAYDGTHYYGWQRSVEGPTIEGVLEKVLTQVLQEQVVLQAASRTDRGVHARAQVVNFTTTRESQDVDIGMLRHALNRLLPADIRVVSVDVARDEFHPTIDNTGKTYRYSICTGPFQMPTRRLYSWHVAPELNVALMQEASRYFEGERDFRALCNQSMSGVPNDTVRTLSSVSVLEVDSEDTGTSGRLDIEVTGSNFLYKMVRNIVGTLVDVGRGRQRVEDVITALESGDRELLGVTAPAHGLSLEKVWYPEEQT